MGKLASRTIGLNTSPVPSTRILLGKVLLWRNTDGYQKRFQRGRERRFDHKWIKKTVFENDGRYTLFMLH